MSNVTLYQKPRPKCKHCGKPGIAKGRSKLGFIKYKAVCTKHDKAKTYKQYKKDHCEHCHFVAIHRCQLDVDHIDGNHKNNDPANLQTLCANCHRLKTLLNKDGPYRCPT